MPKDACDADVLVVGAGPVGLAAAIELARRHCTVRVIEQSGRIGRQPRAKTTNVRTMEHMRRWGLAGQVRDAAPLPAGYPNRVAFGTGLFGRVVSEFTNCFNADRVRDDRYAEPAQWIPQYEIERILRGHAEGLPGCTITFGTALSGFHQDGDGVTAELADASRVRARYLIGADGAHSTVREALGVTMQGDSRIANFLSLVLRVPGLSARQTLGEALMYWLVNPRLPGVMGPMDRDDVWFWGTPIPPDARLSAGEISELVTRSLGPDVAFEILVTDFWIARRLQADRYGRGRVWLAGDACHLHPPFGGYGMNLGIADAVDLGWKLAATLQGWGGPALLPSYEAERRPVHAAVIAESVENMTSLGQHFVNPLLDSDGPDGDAARAAANAAIQAAKDREFHSLGLVIGYGYGPSPILPETCVAAPPMAAEYVPSAAPGSRAPHAWLTDGASLFDRFGQDFTLLQFGPANHTALLDAAASAGMPITHAVLEDKALHALFAANLVLVRPDQHVAWRGDTAADAAAIVARARGAG